MQNQELEILDKQIATNDEKIFLIRQANIAIYFAKQKLKDMQYDDSKMSSSDVMTAQRYSLELENAYLKCQRFLIKNGIKPVA